MAHPPGQLPPYKKPDKPNSPWEPGKSPAPSKKDTLAKKNTRNIDPFGQDNHANV